MTFFKEFNDFVTAVNKDLRSVTKRLKACSEGHLVCGKNGKKYVFYEEIYIDGKRKRTALTCDEKKQIKLAYKECLESDYEVLRSAKDILSRAKADLERLFLKSTSYAPANAVKGDALSLKITNNEWHEHFLKDTYPMLAPSVLYGAVDLLNIGSAWMKQSYPTNSMHFNPYENYVTSNDIHVRSRAEMLIANMLLQRGLSFRYECLFEVGCNSFYPDFTIMHPYTGELFYLEYFGLMDDKDYRDKAFQKIAAYQTTQVADHFIFIFECEASSFDSELIENILDRYFMD